MVIKMKGEGGIPYDPGEPVLLHKSLKLKNLSTCGQRKIEQPKEGQRGATVLDLKIGERELEQMNAGGF